MAIRAASRTNFLCHIPMNDAAAQLAAFALALVIHFILLSTNRFNWLEGPRPAKTSSTSEPATPLKLG